MRRDRTIGRFAGVVGFAWFMGLAATTAQAQVVVQPPRDRPPLPQVGTGAIKGRVVDGQTGTAVARARVRVMGVGLQRAPILTDASGMFALTGLPRGAFTIGIDKSTYLQARYPEPGQTLRTGYRPLTLTDGQVIEGVTIPLFHGSAIAGRVVDANGDPVEFAQVQAFRLPRSGRGRPQQRSGGSTNDLGEFRLARLEPGKYFVLVLPQRREMFLPPGMSDVAEGQQPVPTFYPGVVAMDQAQPIAVERGTSAIGVEIALVDGVSWRVSGTLVDASGQPVTRNGSISVRPIIKDVGGGFGTAGTGVKPDGTFELRLAPGEYEVEARAMPGAVNGPPRPGSEQFGSVRLTVSGDVNGLTIPLGAGATVTGRIVFDGTAPVPAVQDSTNGPGRITFTSPDGPGCRTGRTEVAADWTFTVDGLFGTCTARFNGGIPKWTLKAVTHNGKDLMDQPIMFTTGQQMRDVEVIMTDKRTELTLHVTDEHGAATREYVALMFSADKARWTDNSRFVRTFVPPPDGMGMYGSGGNNAVTVLNGAVLSGNVVVRSGAGGSEPIPGGASRGSSIAAPGGSTARPDTISAMPAGEYYVIAVDDLDGETARDPETLQQLARGATRVKVADGVPADVSLRRFKLHDNPDR